jgi:hypothetical protein
MVGVLPSFLDLARGQFADVINYASQLLSLVTENCKLPTLRVGCSHAD